MNIFIGILVGLFVLMFLVTAHEFGHFIAARRNGVKVLEFGICFPPRAIAWKKGKDGKWHKLPKSEWEKPQDSLVFSLNWLPIGGFCQMDGESATDSRKGTFGAANFWSKTKILFAGVGMNWLISILILTVLAWTGMPKFLENQFSIASDETSTCAPVLVAEVVEDSPADLGGIQINDQISSIDGQTVCTATEISQYNTDHAGQIVAYGIIRGEENLDLQIELNELENSEYLLGISMTSSQTLYYSTWSAPIVGVGLTAQLTGETLKGVGELLWNLVSGVFSQFSPDSDTRSAGQAAISAAGDSVTGPVGIIGIIFPNFASTGITNVAFLAALISVSLACMNILPIPALDGGRWLLIGIYKLLKKPLKKETEEKIVSRAFMVILGLAVIVTILDVTRFF